jgi:hypothetical protein
MATIGPTMLVIYIFFSAYVCPKKNFDLKKYICFLLVILGLTTTIHLAIYRLHADIFKDQAFTPWWLGWGNINCAATLLLLAIPSCWFLITQVKNMSVFFIILAIIAVTPLTKKIKQIFISKCDTEQKKKAYEIISIAIPVIILILSTFSLVGDSYNPFLYFQF